jgi:hypothetical protein
MPSVARTLEPDPPLFREDELIELRRNILRYARSFPPALNEISTGRSQHRFARCFKTTAGSKLTPWTPVNPVDPFHFGTNADRPYWSTWCVLPAERGRRLKLHTCRN